MNQTYKSLIERIVAVEVAGGVPAERRIGRYLDVVRYNGNMACK